MASSSTAAIRARGVRLGLHGLGQLVDPRAQRRRATPAACGRSRCAPGPGRPASRASAGSARRPPRAAAPRAGPRSGTTNSGDPCSPCPRSRSSRSPRTVGSDAGGTRLSTIAIDAPRSTAPCSTRHGSASPYRAAVVTNSHRSAASRSRCADSRLDSSTESRSGASSSAMPRGTCSSDDHRHRLEDGVVRQQVGVERVVHQHRAAGWSAAARRRCSPRLRPASSPAWTCPPRSTPTPPRPRVRTAPSGAAPGARPAGRPGARATRGPRRCPRSPAGSPSPRRRAAGHAPRPAATSRRAVGPARRAGPRQRGAPVQPAAARLRGLHWRGAGLRAHATIVAVRPDLAKRATRGGYVRFVREREDRAARR